MLIEQPPTRYSLSNPVHDQKLKYFKYGPEAAISIIFKGMLETNGLVTIEGLGKTTPGYDLK